MERHRVVGCDDGLRGDPCSLLQPEKSIAPEAKNEHERSDMGLPPARETNMLRNAEHCTASLDPSPVTAAGVMTDPIVRTGSTCSCVTTFAAARRTRRRCDQPGGVDSHLRTSPTCWSRGVRTTGSPIWPGAWLWGRSRKICRRRGRSSSAIWLPGTQPVRRISQSLRPRPETLRGLDRLVIDLPDIGAALHVSGDDALLSGSGGRMRCPGRDPRPAEPLNGWQSGPTISQALRALSAVIPSRRDTG